MNPIFIEIGNIRIYWYSIFILIAMATGCLIILKEAKKYNISKVFIENLFFNTIIFALIGARLYYVIFEYKQYIHNPIDILKVWEGGLAIHGGIVAGLITIIIICKKYKIHILKVTDMVVVGLIIGQAIGRWGNFFNSEAYGPVTTLSTLQNILIPNGFINNVITESLRLIIFGPLLSVLNYFPQFIIDGMYILGNYRHPTFLYESMWNILGFIILIFLRKTNKLKLGQLTGIYFIFYSIGRFFIESMRQDSLMLFGVIKQAQLISLILIVVGIILIILSNKNKKYSEE